MSNKISTTLIVPDEMGGLRLDQALTKLLPDFSRTQIQEWIKNENITVDGGQLRARSLVLGGETIIIDASLKAQPEWQAQDIQLNIVYEDDSLLVINKPAGMVVHPAAGNLENTLLNALLFHEPTLQALPRAGIIHRLDKDTSGLLIIAKTQPALMRLSAQIKARSMVRLYQTVVCGIMTGGGTIEEPIARHHNLRTRMAVSETGKPAITHYRVMNKYRAHTRLKIKLETGRTHQIRVHMAHIHYPIVGDPVYGGRLQLPKGASPALITKLRQFKRQALHACELRVTHPITQEDMIWKAPLPDDMQTLIDVLEEDATQ